MSTNVAALLAQTGQQVVLVDLDLAFGDVAISMQIEPEHTIAEAKGMGTALDGRGLTALTTAHPSGVKVLAAPIDPASAEALDEDLLQRVLATLAEQFDYVVVDTAPALDAASLAAFDASDQLLLLTTLDIPSLKDTKVSLATLDALGYARDKISLVLNRADSKGGWTRPRSAKPSGWRWPAGCPVRRTFPRPPTAARSSAWPNRSTRLRPPCRRWSHSTSSRTASSARRRTSAAEANAGLD